MTIAEKLTTIKTLINEIKEDCGLETSTTLSNLASDIDDLKEILSAMVTVSGEPSGKIIQVYSLERDMETVDLVNGNIREISQDEIDETQELLDELGGMI